jgi:intracellular multiplication protein IcmK
MKQISAFSLLIAMSMWSTAGAQQASPPALPATMVPVGIGYGTAVPPVAPDPLDDPEYNTALRQEMPLTPAQIKEALRLRAQVTRATATPGGQAAQPDIRTVNVSLTPGSPPPVVHLEEGNITTLIFEDQTGAPWPVTGVFIAPDAGVTATIIGNNLIKDASATQTSAASSPQQAGAGNDTISSPSGSGVAQQLAEASSNIVALDPTSSAIVGKDLVVTLQGYNLPVMFTFDGGGAVVDYRTNVMVPANGPNAVVVQPKPDMPSIEMDGIQQFVDGVPPSGATKLDISDPSIAAWYYKSRMFVRTADTMASPSDYSRTSPTGVSVYVLAPTPIFDVFFNGALEQVNVSSLPPAYDYSSTTTSQSGGPSSQENNQ